MDFRSPESKQTALPFRIPATPNLQRLGYGTGVGVFRVERSPRNGQYSSPWALKKLMRKKKRKNDESDLSAQRLHVEAGILKKLNHPNIVGYRGFSYTKDGRECLAMEQCTISLGDLIEERNTNGDEIFAAKDVMSVAKQVAEALNYLHNEVYLLHGDVKSHNVLIKGNFDNVKLCDFGVSLPLNPDGKINKEKADGAKYVGTYIWCAPEVVTDKMVITDKADMFAYGLTLWEMMSLSAPYLNKGNQSESSIGESDELDDSQLESLVGTRPEIPVDVSENEEYQLSVLIFNKCTEEDCQLRASSREILNLIRDKQNV